jgi:hypothetical protein
MPSHLSHNHPNNSTGSNYNTGASDNFTYPKDTNPGLPHYIRFVARRSYTSTQSKRGTPNGEVVLYMPPDALKTSYSQGIGDVEMGGFISLAGSNMGDVGAQMAAGNMSGAAAAATVIKDKVVGANLVNVVKDGLKTAVGGALKKFGADTQGGVAPNFFKAPPTAVFSPSFTTFTRLAPTTLSFITVAAAAAPDILPAAICAPTSPIFEPANEIKPPISTSPIP